MVLHQMDALRISYFSRTHGQYILRLFGLVSPDECSVYGGATVCSTQIRVPELVNNLWAPTMSDDERIRLEEEAPSSQGDSPVAVSQPPR